MAKWTKRTYRLPENHGWQCRKGFKSFVADRGAVRFDIPSDWVVLPGDNSVKFHDHAPPEDTCVLEMSIFRLHPAVDWSGLELAKLLADVMDKDRRDVLGRGEVQYRRRGDFELAWLETRFLDKDEDGQPKEACSRCLMARRGALQILITFAWWPEDAARVLLAWDELLASLRLGEYVVAPLPRGKN